MEKPKEKAKGTKANPRNGRAAAYFPEEFRSRSRALRALRSLGATRSGELGIIGLKNRGEEGTIECRSS